MKEVPFSFIKELIALGFSIETETEIIRYVRRNLRRMDDLARRAYEGEVTDFPICRLRPLGRLGVLIWKLTEIRRQYESTGVPAAVIDDTFSDIILRQKLFWQKNGRVGLSRTDCVWLRHLVNAKIFKLGVLQYQMFKMLYLEQGKGGSEMFMISETQKERLPAGVPVLNVHIQEGADLSPELVAGSLQTAKEFFTRYFPVTQFKALICYSWLLHSGLKDLLPSDSRIIQFAKNFEVISQTNDDTQAIERIFGKRFRRKADYPQETRLQRGALRDRSKLGYALGVIYLDQGGLNDVK